jgi:glycosyltransferase involved in cell wall biosynthesis
MVVKEYIENDNKATVIIEDIFSNIEETKFNRAEVILNQLIREEINHYIPSDVVNSEPSKDRIILINLNKNSGAGAATARGYKWCKDYGIDCVAKMDGDGQMDPSELKSLCFPIVNDEVDYVKGNRLIHRSALLVIPKLRYLGNSVLSILTKIASGYWHVSDTQTGYTAISNKALNSIKLHNLYPSYGYPNDLLVQLNIAMCSIREVPIKPVYDIGESSKMKVFKVVPKISLLLIKSFFKRLWRKYLFRDFHPLFILYHFAFILGIWSVPYGLRVLERTISGEILSEATLMVFILLFITSFQAFLFAMWMDIQDNERLYK